MDRIQQLRREYLQARVEGAAPSYEELEARRRGPEYDQHRVRHQTHTPLFTFHDWVQNDHSLGANVCQSWF
ncbi:hypothetical protein PO909_033626 [Leuciscus waleckii]